MPNGKPGDHPLTDITLWGISVYSPKADALIREIVELGGGNEISDLLFFQYSTLGKSKPDIPKLEGVLTEIRGRLKKSAEKDP